MGRVSQNEFHSLTLINEDKRCVMHATAFALLLMQANGTGTADRSCSITCSPSEADGSSLETPEAIFSLLEETDWPPWDIDDLLQGPPDEPRMGRCTADVANCSSLLQPRLGS